MLLLAVLAVPGFEARACGICIDDKIASCYDHAVVTALLAAIAALPGVQRASGRVSLESAALSFAVDPARTTTEAARRDAQPS